MQATAPIASGKSCGEAQVSNRDSDDRDSIGLILRRRLDKSDDRGAHARLDLPEYQLRQVINEGLGHRNFNAFLNRYRIGEAKAALSDRANGTGADHGHGRRIPVDRTVQSRFQG
jgi:hypothetical protein